MKIVQMNIADVKPYERNPRINDNTVAYSYKFGDVLNRLISNNI
jgi:hypothetical protein